MGADVDRFAAAILVSEILGWYDPDVVAASSEESYFDSKELQHNGFSRFETLSRAVARHGTAAAELLRRAWDSKTFAECPTLEEWAQTLEDIKDAGVWTKTATPQTQFDPQSVWQEAVSPPNQYAPFWVSAAPSAQDASARWDDSANTPHTQRTDGGVVRWIDMIAVPNSEDL